MRIIATAGPLKDQVFHIGDIETIIGRQKDNDICLEDDLVSRRHCGLRLLDGRAVARDLQSKNGIYVNGEAVKEKVLRQNDILKVGSSTFICKERDDIEEILPEFDDTEHDRARGVSTLRAERSDVLFPNTDPLQVRILDAIFETIRSARRAAVLLLDRNREEFVSSMHRPAAFAASRKITHQVLADGLPILSNDGDSVLCAVLAVSDTKIGVIYADSPDAEAFGEHDLRQFRAIARLASAGFEPSRYVEWLEAENHRLKEEINIEHEMTGQSPKMLEVYDFIQKVAGTDSSVMILGQSGTGKELVARAIHRNSGRANRPFIAVNCGAVPETLIESELFGNEKGAFTGATMQRKGRIEAAAGGTLFLDEAGEIPPRMQVTLLRVLQEKEFERVGGTKTIKTDVRIIVATNRNLEQEMKAGRFREDLYYRLNVFQVTLPPLAERREDLPLLVDYFVRKYGPARGISGVSPEAMRLIETYDWPGNIRELGNAMERACGFAKPNLIRPEDLPEAVRERRAPISGKRRSYHDQLNDCKRTIIQPVLDETGGKVPEAAEILDIHTSCLYKLIHNLGL